MVLSGENGKLDDFFLIGHKLYLYLKGYESKELSIWDLNTNTKESAISLNNIPDLHSVGVYSEGAGLITGHNYRASI